MINVGQVDFDANAELATLFHVSGTKLPCMRIGAAEHHEIVPEGAPDGTKPMTSVSREPRLPQLFQLHLMQMQDCVSVIILLLRTAFYRAFPSRGPKAGGIPRRYREWNTRVRTSASEWLDQSQPVRKCTARVTAS